MAGPNGGDLSGGPAGTILTPIVAGTVYGRLTLTGGAKRARGPKGVSFVEAECTCGTVRWFRLHRIREGKVKSCGCWRRDRMAKNIFGLQHGGTDTPEHRAWSHMLARCYNPNSPRYKRYGGRGIYVCAAWREDFPSFLRDMGPRPSGRHSLDRRNNAGSYTCGKCAECVARAADANCRWATSKEQGNNRDTNVRLEHAGRTQNVTQWAAELGIPERAIHHRLRYGWSVADALSKPLAVNGLRRRDDRAALLDFRGERLTLSDWSKRFGLRLGTVHMRIRARGWSLEKALTTPATPSRRRAS